MTIPDERFRALQQIPPALTALALYRGPLRKADVRDLVRRLLRHYPFYSELVRMAQACPELLEPPEQLNLRAFALETKRRKQAVRRQKKKL